MFDRERIRRARKQAGLTQAALGERIGKSADTIRGYESGRIHPPLTVLERIAEVTGKPLDWFLTPRFPGTVASFDPDAPTIPPGLQRLIDMGLPLRQDELADLIAYADPRDPSRGAHGAANWTPGQWLDVLIEERRKRAGE